MPPRWPGHACRPFHCFTGLSARWPVPRMSTTRTLIRGIAVEDTSQLIFMDTPGIFAPKRRLDRAMVTGAWGVAQDADLIALLIDAQRGLDEEARAILERLAPLRQPKLLVL